jgi:hypothetical protein
LMELNGERPTLSSRAYTVIFARVSGYSAA